MLILRGSMNMWNEINNHCRTSWLCIWKHLTSLNQNLITHSLKTYLRIKFLLRSSSRVDERQVLAQILLPSEENHAGIAVDAQRLVLQSPPQPRPDGLRSVGLGHVSHQFGARSERLAAQRAVVIESDAATSGQEMLVQQRLTVEWFQATGANNALGPDVVRLSAGGTRSRSGRRLGLDISVLIFEHGAHVRLPDVSDQIGPVPEETGAVFVAARVAHPDVFHQHRTMGETFVAEVTSHLCVVAAKVADHPLHRHALWFAIGVRTIDHLVLVLTSLVHVPARGTEQLVFTKVALECFPLLDGRFLIWVFECNLHRHFGQWLVLLFFRFHLDLKYGALEVLVRVAPLDVGSQPGEDFIAEGTNFVAHNRDGNLFLNSCCSWTVLAENVVPQASLSWVRGPAMIALEALDGGWLRLDLRRFGYICEFVFP